MFNVNGEYGDKIRQVDRVLGMEGMNGMPKRYISSQGIKGSLREFRKRVM